MDDIRDWHRWFGLSWMDFFHGLPVSVEVEKDLSLRQQYLDVVIIRREEGPLPVRLPDGLEDLGPHNLITFKSHHEALDVWACQELVGHYVNYRKQASPSLQELLPEDVFRLYAVCAISTHTGGPGQPTRVGPRCVRVATVGPCGALYRRA